MRAFDPARLDVSVVVPHYNNAAQTLALIRRIRETCAADGGVEIVVVDDASPDGSFKELSETSGSAGFTVYKNPVNFGYGATVNRGAALASGHILAVANTDIEFTAGISAAYIFSALDAALGTSGAGAVMPLVFNTALGEIENLNDIWAHRGLLWLKRKKTTSSLPDEIHTELCGAFFAMRRTLFLELGGFDPTYSPYFWEDVDLGERIRRRGKSVSALSGTTVNHLHNKSIGPAAGEKRKWLVMRSNQIKFSRLHGAAYGLGFSGLWRFIRGFRSLLNRHIGLALEFWGVR